MGHTIEISVNNHGLILIPSELKNLLGLSPGMTMVVEQSDNDTLCLRVQSETPELIDKQGITVVKATCHDDIENITRIERDRRVFDLVKKAVA